MARGSGEMKLQVRTRSRASCQQPTRCSRRRRRGTMSRLVHEGKVGAYTRTAGLERTSSGTHCTAHRTKELPSCPIGSRRVGYLSASTRIREIMLVRAIGTRPNAAPDVRALGPRDSACIRHLALNALQPLCFPHTALCFLLPCPPD